tara:strand:+ start:323 stop:448 length:126 start_codon:yes stop_codon:yes gene_type:complete
MKEPLEELNNQFNPKGIKFEDAGAGWERYKQKIKEKNNGIT